MIEPPPICYFFFNFITPLGIICKIQIFRNICVSMDFWLYVWILWGFFGYMFGYFGTFVPRKSSFFRVLLFLFWFCSGFSLILIWFFFEFCLVLIFLVNDECRGRSLAPGKHHWLWYHVEIHSAQFDLGLIWWILDLY